MIKITFYLYFYLTSPTTFFRTKAKTIWLKPASTTVRKHLGNATETQQHFFNFTAKVFDTHGAKFRKFTARVFESHSKSFGNLKNHGKNFENGHGQRKVFQNNGILSKVPNSLTGKALLISLQSDWGGEIWTPSRRQVQWFLDVVFIDRVSSLCSIEGTRQGSWSTRKGQTVLTLWAIKRTLFWLGGWQRAPTWLLTCYR